MCRCLGSYLCLTALDWLHIDYEVYGRQEEMNPIGLGHERIDGLQSTVGEFHVIDQHDDGHVGPHLLDLIGDSCAIHESKVVLEDDGIHGPRHEKPQAIGTVGSGCQLIAIFLQHTQLSWVAVYTQQGAVGSHASYVYQGRFR